VFFCFAVKLLLFSVNIMTHFTENVKSILNNNRKKTGFQLCSETGRRSGTVPPPPGFSVHFPPERLIF